ncbi:hypothetical protein [Aquimarina longa]|uniref:hypothetical protein n=1 Tax=Aquimarina longa TaxID=1080221 RepID=UPI000781FA4E|nr:hypothetical protein [Aquimarina longa]
MKKTIKLVSILLVCTFIGCKGEMNDELLKKEFTSLVQSYYINYPPIKSIKDLERLKKYLEINHQNLDIIKKHSYELHLDSVNRILYVETNDILFQSKASIDLFNEIGIFDRCSNEKIEYGPFSKDGGFINSHDFIKELHNAISTYNINFGIPTFNKESPRYTKVGILFSYEYGKLSVYCIKNDVPNEVVNQIMQFLDDFLASKKPLPFDFAFIPIEIK